MKEMLSVYILNNFKPATVTDILHSRCMAIAVVMMTIKSTSGPVIRVRFVI